MTSPVWISFKLSDYRSHRYKIAISLPELVEATNAFSVKNRPGCQPSLQRSDPKDLFLKYNVKCNLPDSDPAGHDVQVHFDVSKVTPEMRANDLDIKCSCSCPAFLYWGAQWNLKQRDALEGAPRPKLVAPTERLDLRDNFVICKHCKAVFERILPAVQHNIVKIIREHEVEQNKPNVPSRSERLIREQEEMKRRQELKRKPKKEQNKEILESLRRMEQDKLLQEEAEKEEKAEVDRTEPATEPAVTQPTPAEQKEKLKEVEPEPDVKEEGHEENHQLINQMLDEEKDKIRKQQEESRKRLKKLRDDKFKNWKKNRNSSLEEDEDVVTS
jgi:hypothetical protein